MFNTVIDLNPLTALFGVVLLQILIYNLLSGGLMSESEESYAIICWVEEVMPQLKLELFQYTAQGSTQKYHQVWEPFLSNNPLFSFLFNIYFFRF